MGEGDKQPGGQPAAKKPELPAGAPKALDQFLECKGNRLTFKSGKWKWVKGSPTVSFAAGENAGTVNVTVGWGIISITLPATVKDGQLSVDTSKLPDLSEIVEGLGPKAIDDGVKEVNDWLKANGKQLGALELKDGAVTIPKVAIPAEKKAAMAPAPGPKTGLKAAAGAGVFVVGFGVGSLLSPTPGTPLPEGPVPIVQAEQMPVGEPQTQTFLHLPPGPVQGQMTITGPPGSFDTQVTFIQKKDNLTLQIPGQVFTGTIDEQVHFLVQNPQGMFEGNFTGDTFQALHVYQGEQFQAEGTIDQPVVEDTVPVGQPAGGGPVLASGIGEGVVLQPVSDASQDGGGLAVAAGLFLTGGGLILLDRASKRDCSEQRAALDAALAGYRRVQGTIQSQQKRLEKAEDEADRLAGEYQYENARDVELELRDSIELDREDLREAEYAIFDAEEALAECEGRAPRDVDELTREATTAEVM